ncbi:30S ribosomal protein S8e [Candidatus Micrarchaeota archaeon]|nr:30S ribosomal protein S8e [Candidatus Micrarchaeota archaeon]
MQQYHRPSNKKVVAGTGGRTRKFRDKKVAHVGGAFSSTKVSDKNVSAVRRARGGNPRIRLKKASKVNVVTAKGTESLPILKVLESHNPEYVRMNIVTKGAVVETKSGKVKITNRVGQDGVVNGVLVK